MSDELGKHAVRISFYAGVVTLALILSAARVAISLPRTGGNAERDPRKAEVDASSLESVTVASEDVKEFQQQLKKQGVEFAVMRDRDTGEHSVFFKGSDADKVRAGLEAVLRDAVGERDGKKPFKEIADRAQKEAARLAERRARGQEKSRTAAKDLGDGA